MHVFKLSEFAETDDFPFFIQYGFHDGGCYLHGHEDFSELVIVLDGSAFQIVENDAYPITKGDVFVLDKYTSHSYTDAENFKICNVMFRPEALFEHLPHIRQNAGFQALFILEPYYAKHHQFCSRFRLKPEDFSFIQKLLAEMIHEHTQKLECWQTLLYGKFIQLCTILSRLYQDSEQNHADDVIKLATAVAYIEKNFCTDISLSDLAQMTGYSERQFHRLFKSAFSVPPSQYITNLRLQKAQLLLKNSNQTIGELSWECGYTDQNYFSRVFKKNIGLTPTEYKQNALW